MIERIHHDGLDLAIIIRREYSRAGIEFFTSDDETLQLGYMSRPTGYAIPPHVHIEAPREATFTAEGLFIRSGRLRVDFYDDREAYLVSTELNAGDVILLMRGGHGFEMLEPTEIIEVKQGPYMAERDKRRFDPVTKERIRLQGDDR